MIVVWIGLGLAGWFVIAVGVGAAFGCAIRAADDREPVWGCDCCQDEAEEIAVLKAWWAAS